MVCCPCQSGQAFVVCCQPLHRGRPASTAERLMRARYSAYVMRDPAFLYRSWSRATRPPKRELATGQPTEWLGLEILRIEQGGEQDDCGLVEFVARYRNGAGEESLHETSRFRRENGRWVYVDGECRQEGEA